MSPTQRAAQITARVVIAVAFLAVLGFCGWLEGLS